MTEGLYRVSFHYQNPNNGLPDPGGFEIGVLYFKDGLLKGGSGNYYYSGNYSLDGTQFTAQLAVRPIAAHPATKTPFGPKGTDLAITGTSDHVGIRCGATLSHLPGDRVQIGLARLVD